MEAQDYPIRHFQFMAQVGEELKSLPAQILDHQYSYEMFGSSWTVVQYKGIAFQVVMDGREHLVIVRRSKSRKAPYDWETIDTFPQGLAVDENLKKIKDSIRSFGVR